MPSWLSKSFIGLPVWAWLAAGVVTGGAVIYFLRRSSSSTATTGNNPTGTLYPTPVPFPVQQQPAQPIQMQAWEPVASFPQWYSGAIQGSRPDLAKAKQEGRWNDIALQYIKEVDAAESANVQHAATMGSQSQQFGSNVTTPTMGVASAMDTSRMV